MRNLILVVLLLQLLLTLKEANGYKFGDLISFKRKCKGVTVLKHFAVYVGDVKLPGKKDGQDIFHHTREPTPNGECAFGVLKDTGEGEEENYMDKCFKEGPFTPNHDDIIKRINDWNKPENCGKYDVLTNNCEHLATHVRYGMRNLRQAGTVAGWTLVQSVDCKKLLDEMKKNQELESNSSC